MPGGEYFGGSYYGGALTRGRFTPVTEKPAPIGEEGTPLPQPGPVPVPGKGDTLLAREVYAALAPVTEADSRNGFALLWIVRAIAGMGRQVEEVARMLEGRPPGSQAFDPKRAPDWLLPFVGLAVGVRVAIDATPAEQRTQIQEESGWRRGSVGSIVSAIQRTLTGQKRVRVTERANGKPWLGIIVTDPKETPNPAWTNREAQQAKPGGLLLIVEQGVLPLIDEGTREINAATADTIDTATYADVT